MDARAIFFEAYTKGGACPYATESNEAELWADGLEARNEQLEKTARHEAKIATGKAKRHEKYKIATIDFETDPAGNGRHIEPFAWGFYDGATYHDYWGSDAAKSLVTFIRDLDEPYLLYAHNGGKFDFQFIIGELERDILFIGSRIVSAKLRGRGDNPIMHEIRDSLSILPVPLADAAEKFEFDYDKMNVGKRQRYRKEIMDYLKQDCVGLYDTIMKHRAALGPGLTMASIAMRKLNEAMCPEGHPAPHLFRAYERLSPKQDMDLRPWFFGGRVQCFKKGIVDAPLTIYDINSSYPYAMLSQLHPVGNQWTITRELGPDSDFALIDATSNGCLPQRAEDGSLIFPIGRSRYFANVHEIKAGLELGLLTIHRVLHARETKEKTTFKKFIEHYYGLRMEAAQADDPVFVLFWKLVMNGAYGKFAQNPRKFRDHQLVLEGEAPPSVEHGWKPEYKTGEYMIYARPTEEYYPGSQARSFLNVATGASITGAARAHLMRGLHEARGVVYCDTDSIICEGLPEAYTANPKALGSWKIEAVGNKVAICEKKLYAFFGEASSDAKTNRKRIKEYGDTRCIKIASKGVRLKAADILKVAKGETVTYHPLFPTLKPDGRQIYTQRRIRMIGA